MKRQERLKKLMSSPIQPLPNQSSLSPPPSLPSFMSLVLLCPHLPFVGFDGPDDGVHGVFHETTKEDKGKKLAFGGFRSLPLVDIKNIKVSLLHVLFNLKGVFDGKEYFRINHLLLPPFNLALGPILLGKSIVCRPTLKELFFKCLL